MMNRGVLSRQMFAKGGAAFPDLTGPGGGPPDGKITQADILMGRGVEFKQEGGIAGMMQPPAPEQLDPQAVEQMMMAASQTTGDLEGAQDYEQMMNMVRGDDASVGERREELAGVVGPEDAMQTPESVLALVQPVMQIAAVDQGIGELAQQEMQQPMQGPMAGGIMENVAPPQPMGGSPPVNFKEGGLVRRGDNQPVQMYAPGGEVENSRLQTAFQKRLPVYQQILGDPSAQLADQKRLTQAQMLFDLANTGLAFAAPMKGEQPGLSPAERLAMAAQQSQLFDKIGARAQAQQDRVAAAEKAKQGIRASALTAAEAQLTAEDKAETERKKLAIEQGYRVSNILLEQTGKMELAQAEANWKAGLQDDQQLAAEALKKLEGIQTQEAIQLRKKLENQNAIRLQLLKGEQALEEIGLRSMNDIAKLEKSHLQALEIQENNAALTREMKSIDQQMKAIDQTIAMDSNSIREAAIAQQAAAESNRTALEQQRIDLQKQGLEDTAAYRGVEQAIKMEDQEIERAKMLQAADEATQRQILEQEKLALDERKVAVTEAAAGLDKFGKGLTGKLLSTITNVEDLEAYETGDLSPQKTADLEASMLAYTDFRTVFDAEIGAMVRKPGAKLPDRAVRARAKREENGFAVAPLGGGAGAPAPAPAATGDTAAAATTATGDTAAEVPADQAAAQASQQQPSLTGPQATQDVGAPLTGDLELDKLTQTTYSSLLDSIDVADAFGAPTAFGQLLNRGVELVTLGTAQAAPKASRSTAIIESINKNATIIYMKAITGKTDKELRKEIEATLPDPAAFTKGEKSALNKAESTLAFLNAKIAPIERELQNLKGQDVGKRRGALESLKQVRDTYAKLVLKLREVVDPKPKPPVSDQQLDDAIFGTSAGG